MWYCCEGIEDANGVGSVASACLQRARRFEGGVMVRSRTSRCLVDASKGYGVKELGFAFVSLGRFRDMVWVSSTITSSLSSMTINFGEAYGLPFELEAVGVRFVAKESVVC